MCTLAKSVKPLKDICVYTHSLLTVILNVCTICTHMVLESVDSYKHWAPTKQQVYHISTATLQALHARVVWRGKNAGFRPHCGEHTQHYRSTRGRERCCTCTWRAKAS